MILYIIDIDNTISNGSVRFVRAGKEPSRANKYLYEQWVSSVNAQMNEDMPIKGMQRLVDALSRQSYAAVLFLTAREERYKLDTYTWLQNNRFDVINNDVVFRPEGNEDEAHVYKEKIIKLASARFSATEVIVIDDDPSGMLAETCKANGWVLLKVVF